MPKKQYADLNLYQKLALIQEVVDVIQKDKAGYSYKYVSEAFLLPKITASMRKYGVSLLPGITPGTTKVEPYQYTKVKAQKNGPIEERVNEFYVQADTLYTWVNNDNPEERIVVPWTMVGNQSDSSMAFGSALTYSGRYFLLKYFHCATVEDDPDEIRAKQAAGMAKSEVDSILNEVGEFIEEVLTANPEARNDIIAIVSRHVGEMDKDGKLVLTANFRKITKRARATALLLELQSKYK